MQSASMEQPPLFRVHSLLSERDHHVGMLAVFIIIDTGKNHVVLDLERIITSGPFHKNSYDRF